MAVEFVVGTGFVGFLTLPQAAVAALGLPYQFDTPASLADDSEVQMAVHSATTVWDGVEQELVVQCADGGAVTVDAL